MPATTPFSVNAFFSIYDFLWKLAIPILARNHRLAQGYHQRCLIDPLPAADIWIQAASAGEAYLATTFLKAFTPLISQRILLTSNTKQGFDILKEAAMHAGHRKRFPSTYVAYFPFDRPLLMETAVKSVMPRIMVLLESEIWPGLLKALKQNDCTVVILNGRMTSGSARSYRLWEKPWRAFCPEHILAISPADAQRFGRLFNHSQITTMPNMKFDRLATVSLSGGTRAKDLLQMIGPQRSFVVLGSIRQEEESDVGKIIGYLKQRHPQSIIGLFPRHLHRLDYWQNALKRMGHKWSLRSNAARPVETGTVILWDLFGELGAAYTLARAAFIGGSLAPLGGQNFLEALICGVLPVIGPYWNNFAWVGEEIIRKGLVHMAKDWKGVASRLSQEICSPQNPDDIQKRAAAFLGSRRGGTRMACRLIQDLLDRHPEKLQRRLL